MKGEGERSHFGVILERKEVFCWLRIGGQFAKGRKEKGVELCLKKKRGAEKGARPKGVGFVFVPSFFL